MSESCLNYCVDIYENDSTENVLSLPSKNLISIPELCNKYLSIIYLQDNQIEIIPDDFFTSLPNLTWLDMRNNILSEIPKTVQNHQKLAHFLLKNNKIVSLPNELGTVQNLKVLQLSGNPIEYPPPEIIKAGTSKIIAFLRDKFLNEILESPSNVSDKTIDLENSTRFRQNPNSSSHNLKSKSRNNLSVQFTEKDNDSDEEQYSKNGGKCPKLAKSRSKTFLTQSSKYLKPLRVPTKSKQDEKMREAFLKELAIKKQKDINAATETILQGRRHKEYLRNWRQNYRNKQLFMGSHNIQQKQDFPYDTNPEYMTILTRADIEKDLPDKYRRRLLRKSKQSVPRKNNEDVLLAMKIKQLFENLEAIDLNRQCMTPRTEQKALLGEIHKITEIKQKLKELSTSNFTSI
ncbi:E3 ubiquitin-protein ligase LRSAM1-like [Aricia agestis]|uniref:E3 ubiquitin-protein ligase LRSAM1-like n=1 Tax=Aricia agestis TaxID=91739 RepID=UPI001C206DC8|nr:E3 ubiquitin-protein ligase LRSAM1-like [Aricia agestis]